MKFNQNKTLMSVCATLIFGLSSVAHAQVITQGIQTQGASPSLVVPQYDSATLQAQGCDPNIMSRLNSDYVAKRNVERQIQGYQAQQLAAAAGLAQDPSKSGGSCYQNAINNIENAAGPFGKLISLFAGGTPDMNAIGSAIGQQLGNMACSQISSYTSQLSYGLTSNINSTQLGGGYTVGSAGGIVNSTVGSNGTLNTTGVANQVSNQVSPIVNSGGGISSVLGNPFK